MSLYTICGCLVFDAETRRAQDAGNEAYDTNITSDTPALKVKRRPIPQSSPCSCSARPAPLSCDVGRSGRRTAHSTWNTFSCPDVCTSNSSAIALYRPREGATVARLRLAFVTPTDPTRHRTRYASVLGRFSLGLRQTVTPTAFGLRGQKPARRPPFALILCIVSPRSSGEG